ncbi:hypothetical protein RJ53_01450 [Methanocalculus chunghsingensis]|uniref:4-alpha-L-fucosyltransferase n=1 Tax=Methanocalculus chunghsingensis TaxID=156457 RepID=A0A8J8B4N9_9EURY|nr:TDP-N-acetylfucosamine:lipid II N-acetylfucosaminyltransferase [Methanocalculus chunghsingensis]MBR1368229.1 hypothetical protein [Methanocalculus chunghsingensis]
MSKKRIIHFFKNRSNIFNDTFVSQVESLEELREHYQHQFIFMDKSPDIHESSCCQYIYLEDSRTIVEKFLIMMNVAKQADLILVHGLFHPYYILLLACCRSLCSKASWVVWGGDIYGWSGNDLPIFYNLLKKIRSLLVQRIINNLNAIVTLSPGDYETILSTYVANAKHLNTFYPNPVLLRYFDQATQSRGQTNNATRNILLNNSATYLNEHIEVIDILKRKEEVPFNLICPLSYGDKESLVKLPQFIKYCKEHLGEKFHPITSFMDPSDYACLLRTINVGIVNYRRQQAIGTITPLLYVGAKVYLRKDTSIYKWLSDLGLIIFNVDELPDISGNEIFEFSEVFRNKNKNIITDHFSNSNYIKMWKVVFDS